MKNRTLCFLTIVAFGMTMFLLGCSAHSSYNKEYVSDAIEEKTGFNLPFESPMDTLTLPAGIILEDGMTEEEAVAIALWNNAQFQTDLEELGFARADLIEAGLLRNPIFSLLFPVGPKQLEWTLSLPIEVLWQRPNRVALAKLNCEKIAENLIQHGLLLVRDVRITFANLSLAQEQLNIITDEMNIINEIAEIASARLRAGDISELEEIEFRITASQIKETFIHYDRDAEIQMIRLKTSTGMVSEESNFHIVPTPVQVLSIQDTTLLVKTALMARPDLRAAELEIEAAGKSLGWERSKILNITATLDANAEGKEGFEMGPGMQIQIPLFNWNSGGTSRAHAEMERSVKHYITLQQSIRKEVLESYQNFQAAKKVYDMLSNEIVPAATQAAKSSEKAYLAGEISYLEFLEFEQQLLSARLRLIDAEAEMHRSIANLYYSMGGQILQS